MDQMTRMNSRVDEIQDFIKTNVQPTTNKKGKQVTFTDQLPSHATANLRNQGASSSQTHNILACMHIYLYEGIYGYVYAYVCMDVCIHVREYACMDVCMYICIYMHVYVCPYVNNFLY